MNDIEQEVETQQVEQDIVNRLPELKQLSSAIDKATTAVINAKLTLESAIRQSQREEMKLSEFISTICSKVDTINDNIDNVMKEAQTKLYVSVCASDADLKKIEAAFAKHRKWFLSENLKHFIKSMICFLMNEGRFRNVTRCLMAATSITTSSGSLGGSLPLASVYS